MVQLYKVRSTEYTVCTQCHRDWIQGYNSTSEFDHFGLLIMFIVIDCHTLHAQFLAPTGSMSNDGLTFTSLSLIQLMCMKNPLATDAID